MLAGFGDWAGEADCRSVVFADVGAGGGRGRPNPKATRWRPIAKNSARSFGFATCLPSNSYKANRSLAFLTARFTAIDAIGPRKVARSRSVSRSDSALKDALPDAVCAALAAKIGRAHV